MRLPVRWIVATLVATFTVTSHSAPFHGHFIICSDETDQIKMTADLSDGKGEKVATGVYNGLKLLFPESSKGRPTYHFAFYPEKKIPITVVRQGQKEPEIRLTWAPSQEAGPKLLHHRTEPFLYRISRYTAFLSIRSFKLVDQKVSCTESQWESD